MTKQWSLRYIPAKYNQIKLNNRSTNIFIVNCNISFQALRHTKVRVDLFQSTRHKDNNNGFT